MIFSVHPHFQFLISAGLWDVVVEDVDDDDNENNDGDYAVDDGGDPEAQKPGWQGGIAIRKVFARNP